MSKWAVFVQLTAAGRLLNLTGKCSIPVTAGDMFRLQTPGGGGYGSPEEKVINSFGLFKHFFLFFTVFLSMCCGYGSKKIKLDPESVSLVSKTPTKGLFYFVGLTQDPY